MKETRKDSDPRGLTTFGRSVGFAGAILLTVGLAFGDYPYLLCSLLLLGVALWSRQQPAPEVEVARILSAEDVRAGDAIGVDLTVTNLGAAGALSLHDKVPDVFLMDGGTNFDAAWLPAGGTARLRYRLRAPRRGQHDIGALRATSFDPLFLQTSVVASAGATTEVLVHPRQPPLPRIRTGSAWGRTHLPGGDKATRGILTNDFRELRPYERGDPLKQVNWKATARQSRGDDLQLIVNDYEVEGKKVIWLFTDASAYTVGGTTLANAFDELTAATLSVAGHYLDLGHRVGLTLYGSGAPRSRSEGADAAGATSGTRILYPDAGELQERRIATLLATADPGQEGENITKAVEVTKGFLARERPLIFVFTLAGRDPELARALVSARALASTGRRAAAIVCVTPVVEEPPEPAPPRTKSRETIDPSFAARVVAVRERAQLKGLERRGVTVIRYHPSRAPLSALLAKGVLR
ncbi:MAG TPA: DUF58 domain-containing protein [Candidatus Thermoplasmatota archaeon]|nr:DUF58 domain-containing protein [Candidatus Thermoplasmatota archaeon]